MVSEVPGGELIALQAMDDSPHFVVIASYARSLVNFRLELLIALRKTGYRVTALAPEDTEVRAVLNAHGEAFQSIPLERTGLNPFADFQTLLSLMGKLIRLRPKAVLAYTIKPVIYGLLAARLVQARRFAMITGLGFAFSQRAGLLTRLVTILYRWALFGSSAVFLQNPDDRALFIELGMVDANRAVLINGSGVDTTWFYTAPPVCSPMTFLLIARLLEDKGVREYAEAARLIRERHPTARFLLMGPLDPNPAAIRASEVESWQRGGILEYPGEQKDVRSWLARASVYVLPTYREGTPRTVLEAMAMARPIITSDAPGCRETVQEGSNGFLVPVRNAGELASAMERFILNPQLVATMGQASRQLAEKKYDVHKVNEAILEVIGRIR